jgi:UDP-glucose:(heptosyl)LPS alpha-1,3-glucosyltransferase
MKLAILRRRFSATGGAELYLQRLLAALREAGHELHLFTEAWEGAPADVRIHPQEVHGTRSQRPRKFAESVRAELALERFDCVFSLERTTSQDVYRAGDGVHRVWLERRRQFAPWWRKPFTGWGGFHRTMLALERQTFDPRNTGHVIVNSGMVRREILEQFRFPEERIHLVRNGVEVGRFAGGRREETRARFGVREGEFLLLFAGSGWERKGLGFLLRGLAALEKENSRKGAGAPPVKLLVAGKGTAPSSAPANVIFAGPLRDLENACAAADLFVFLPIYEPSANVCFEAMAAGLPVITTAQNGAGEIIEEGVTGSVLKTPDDPGAVAGAIRPWMTRPRVDRRASLPDLTLGRNVAETVAILELAAREKRGGTPTRAV